MGEKIFWCRNCHNMVTEDATRCPKCQKSNLVQVNSLFTSIIKELATYYSQMVNLYYKVDKMAREVGDITRRYITLKKSGLHGRDHISSKILNFYAKLSCLVESLSAKIQTLRKEFEQFQGKNDALLPPSASMGKVATFESQMLGKLYSLKRDFEERVPPLNSPKEGIYESLRRLERKKHLIRLFKSHRTLQEREKLVKIIASQDRRRLLFITTQRLLVIQSLKNRVVKEVPLSEITEVELKGWFFTKEVVLCFSNQKEMKLGFGSELLSNIRESIELGKEAESDTFIVEHRVFKPSTPQLINAVTTLFKEIVMWVDLKQHVVRRGEKEAFDEDLSTDGEENGGINGELTALNRTLEALEDAFKKDQVKPEYYFDKKFKIERKISEIQANRP
ncbi:MAG: hypothetical protein GWO20_03135 [Candidatus Korarchaeota archaeon]|nr:hypothetical protein [Candidatus Korarchaeota archaeon]NIU82481.1 hypothetical protein [Candidatus Thorarchaeota archaeon]NIW12967.1 hypothetical protein [Candidatus Thorarchaeota archaeon]NIW51120.1 hypothetical protein [Candidatus Korarchaeota archaeon]